MAIKIVIRNLEGINWERDHYIHEEDISLQDFINEGEIEVGDIVTIENKDECVFPLGEGEYCITFDKTFEDGASFFHEELFTLEECRILFGEDFNY